MAELTDSEIEAANRRGEIEMRTKPRAVAVSYDPARDRITVELANGTVFVFPPRLLQGFETATADEIAEVEIIGAGFGLHWESLDADFRLEGLLVGRFGTRRYMLDRFGADWDAVAAE